MLETKDIRPLLKELFAKDFIQRTLKNEHPEWSISVKRKLALKLSKSQLRRFFIAENNWTYLNILCYFSWRSSTETGQRNDDPPSVVRNMRRWYRLTNKDPYLRVFAPDRENGEKTMWPIDSKSKVLGLLSAYQRAVPILRSIALRTNAGHTPQWNESFEHFSTRYHLYEPRVDVCDDECYGTPKGTRIFIVDVPVFQLAMIQTDRGMKIVRAIYVGN
jgi:hypothetical protein